MAEPEPQVQGVPAPPTPPAQAQAGQQANIMPHLHSRNTK